MATIKGFKIMRTAFDNTVKSPHLMYFKMHIHQKQSKFTPSNRTIFVANVPPYCTKEGLQNVFGSFGSIKEIFLQDLPGPVQHTLDSSVKLVFSKDHFCFKVAYIVFQNPTSVEALMRSELSTVYYMSQKKKRIRSGLQKWCTEYRKQYSNPKDVEKKVDRFMAEFDLKEAKEKEKLERLASEPDEEGWTVVTHGKKSLVELDRVTKKDKKKREKKELANFYTFQQRESKREHIATLRKKFEEDKKKIQQLRAARKFKPF